MTRSLSASAREAVYDRARGALAVPLCNLCGLPVLAGQEWDVSHEAVPAALGGTAGGVAHRRCNRVHGFSVVVPLVAKVKRMRRRHIGAAEHGQGRRRMPCGRHSKFRRTISGRIVLRNQHTEDTPC